LEDVHENILRNWSLGGFVLAVNAFQVLMPESQLVENNLSCFCLQSMVILFHVLELCLH